MESLSEYLNRNKPEGFEPRPRYLREADAMVFFFKSDESYAQRLDNIVTIYRSEKTQELVGCKIKGVTAILNELGDFNLRVKGEGIDLRWIFYAYSKTAQDSEARETYRRLSQEADRVRAELSEDELVPS